MMTAANDAGRKASLERYKELSEKFDGTLRAEHALGTSHLLSSHSTSVVTSGVYFDGLITNSQEAEASIAEIRSAAGTHQCSVVVSHSEGLGQLLHLLALDVNYVDVEFPSNFASQYQMIIIRMVPENPEVAKYFGFPEPFHEPRATARCRHVDEKSALETCQQQQHQVGEQTPVSSIMQEIESRPFRVINLKSEALADNQEGATCLTAILSYVSGKILSSKSSASSFGLSKDYSFALLHHMVVCNEPNAQHVLEWHNWTVIGLLFKLASHVRKAKGLRIYHQYLLWIGLVNSPQPTSQKKEEHQQAEQS